MKTILTTHVTEISETSIRSVMTSFLNMSSSIGVLAAFIVNLLMPWRKIALFGAMVSFISSITMFIVSKFHSHCSFTRQHISIVRCDFAKLTSIPRFLNHRNGFCRSLERNKPNDRYVGFEVRRQAKQWPKSSVR